MKLRLAKKICKAITEDRGDRYTAWQQWKAVNRIDRTKSAKAAESLWCEVMELMGPEGRAEMTQRFIERDEDRDAELTVKKIMGAATEADLEELAQVRRNLAYFRDGGRGDGR